jgi:hypothetical protein
MSLEIAKELRITFQLHTKSVQELHKIRFWIQTIANTCFEKVIIRDAFHPEFLHLLFPPDTCKPIMFRADETLILEYSQLYQPLRQNIFARTLELPTKKYPSKSDFVNLILFICNTDDTRFSSISKVQIGEIMESGVDNVLVMANFQQIFEVILDF